MSTTNLVCGIDVGTSAARALVCDTQGSVVGSGHADLPRVSANGPRREQDPASWWSAVCDAVRKAVSSVDTARIVAIAVDATSGTLVLVDRKLSPLGPGLMYNDARATGYGDKLNQYADEFTGKQGIRFKDNFSLSRMLWLRDHDPEFNSVYKILHQSDFINANLIGLSPPTDWSNALKSGCDLFTMGWAEFIEKDLAFPMEKLPGPIVAPGTKIGVVCKGAAHSTGLKEGTAVCAGASDGTAALIASGARLPGDGNTTLGSTLVLKGISENIVRDPDGVVYCHRHPDGHWLPGGAGNVGCSALNEQFAPDPHTRTRVLSKLDAEAARRLPCSMLTYPLGDATEERFPFKKGAIESFTVGTARDETDRYAATLQGVAFVERWCYEKLDALGARTNRVFSTGGGSRSDIWNQLRADVLGKVLELPEECETAFGAAILAAAGIHGTVGASSKAMVRIRKQVEPERPVFEELYDRFRSECRKRWGV